MDNRLRDWVTSQANDKYQRADIQRAIAEYLATGKPQMITTTTRRDYRAVTQNCNDFIDNALDVFLGYNWFREPFLTTADDLIQQIRERFTDDGQPK